MKGKIDKKAAVPADQEATKEPETTEKVGEQTAETPAEEVARPEKSKKRKKIPAKVFFKRYWYWFAVIALLIGGIVGWCAGMGYLDKSEAIDLRHEMIVLTPFSYYKLADYAGKERVTYEIPDEYTKIISIEDNIIYAKKIGFAKIVAVCGKERAETVVNVEPITLYWKVGIGETFAERDLIDICVPISGIDRVNNSNSEVLAIEFGDDTDTMYTTKKEGLSVMSFSFDDVDVCTISILVKKDLAPEERSVTSEIEILEGTSVFASEPHLMKSESRSVNSSYYIPHDIFTGEGYIFFHTGNKEIANIRQDGSVIINMPGSVLLTAVCMDLDGKHVEYFSYKLSVNEAIVPYKKKEAETEWRDLRVGDVFTEFELREAFDMDSLSTFEVTASDCIKMTKDENGQCVFTVLDYTYDRDVGIDGYSDKGKKLVRYTISVEEELADEE